MPPRDPQRVFLSGCTAEFGQTRSSLREALARTGCHVVYQNDFPQTQADTVLKLAQLIEPCGTLVHLIGRDPGSVANKTAVAEYLAIADKDGGFLKSQPDLRTALGDFSDITYTQWEAFIALHLGIPVFVYADATQDAPSHPQRQHLDSLIQARRYAQPFTDELDLHKKVLADLNVHLREAHSAVPISLSSSVRHNLPSIQRFFGRDAELAKLLPDLHPDATGWGALIDGPGGMGKTSLAIRAAELAAPGHYDEIIFLSAKQTAMDPHGPHDESPFAVSGFTQMLDAIARRFQKTEITQAPADERPRLLIDVLTGSRTLLVLDNLETLTDADQRSLLAFLGHLPRTCKALLTSRPLVIATGRRLKLQQLDQAAALQTLADIARDNPALDAAPEPDRLHLITETGGNTLLLTWTAWQVGSGYCTTIADALAHLRSCPQGNDPLEFIFGDHLARFTPEEERIVATLSYPTEPIPVTAIAEISGVDEPTTRRALKLLTNRSIVVPQEGEEKYALVPMVAEFIRHARAEVVQQMGIWLADRAFRLINVNGRKHFSRFTTLESMWPTVSPALPIFLVGDNTRLQAVCDSLQKFFDFQGRWDEWLLLSQQAEAKAVQAGDFAEAGWRAHNVAAVFSLRHRGDDVLTWADRAASHWQVTAPALREKAAAIRLQGVGHKLKGNYPAAISAFREVLGLFRSVSDVSTDVSNILNSLAGAEQLSGDLVAAERDYREARRIAIAGNFDENIATSTGNLAAMALARDDWTNAEALAREALHFSNKVGRHELIAGFSHILAQALIRQGKATEAKYHAQHSVGIFERLRSPRLRSAQAVLTECENSLAVEQGYP